MPANVLKIKLNLNLQLVNGLNLLIGEKGCNKMSFARLKDYMDRLVSEYKVPGVDCMVYKEHEVIFRYFTGMRDVENKIAMNGKELYIIYSMTKMLTCTCALQLLEQGKFIINDPISKFLPEFKDMKIINESNADDNDKVSYAKTPITVKHLFTMGAGLNYELKADYINKALLNGKKSTRELVASMSNTVLGFEPGTRFSYSLCHDVLGALIEVISGKNLGEYMKDNIFIPLGMNNTFFGVPNDDKLLSKMAVRYDHNEFGELKRLPYECMYNLSDEYQSGGAGLVSCTEDYAIFLDAMANGGRAKNGSRILSSPTIELMKTNHLNEKQLEDFQNIQKGYGYGLGVRTHIDKTVSGSISPLGEFGWDGAAGAFSMVDTQNKLSLTYFQEMHGWDIRTQTEMRNILYTCLD